MAKQATDALLRISDLHVHYITEEETVRAVNGLSLELKEGESLGLVGETGAGKTTTALSIMQLVPNPPGKIVRGSIEFNGQDLVKTHEGRMRQIRGNDISMIFQDPMTSLNPVYTVGDQIAEVIRVHDGITTEEAMKRAGDLLALVGIPASRLHDYPHQFSGGMKQRVVIAIALACNPKLLLADEPTTALDVTIQAQVLEMMRGLKDKFNTAMILITHDLGVVAEVCDKVAIMYAGEIVECGTLEQVYNQPLHPYTVGLFGSIPNLEDESERLSPIDGLMPDPANLPEGCPFHPRCPHAATVCAQENPKVVNDQGHQVKCLIYHGRVQRKEGVK
ncbi:MAG: ABC transporter ATP-binding protein [Bacillota bacterium]